MAIGGERYLARLEANEQRLNYGSRMNRQRVEQSRQAALSLSTSLFSIGSSYYSELTTLTMQHAVQRIEAAVQQKNTQLQSAVGGLDMFA